MEGSSPMLVAAGWTPRVHALFASTEPAPHHELARVAQSGVTHAVVVTAEGWLTVTAEISEDAKDIALVPTTGDWVVLDTSYEPPVITTILPRWSTLTRGDALGREEQVLAADVDLVLIVLGLDRPRKAGRVERALALAWDSGAVPVVVLTKADLVSSTEVHDTVAEMEALARGVEVLVTTTRPASAGIDSAAAPSTGTHSTGTDGIEPVRQLLRPDRTAVLIGESGAGKSTLVNALVGDEVQITALVRDGDAKGRHTTTTRDLVPLEGGGVLIDTPGIRGVSLWDSSEGVARVFDDIEALADACRFPNCEHRTEPGCAVLAAVADGTVDRERMERWMVYIEELDEQDARRVTRERAAEKKAGDRALAKALRVQYNARPEGRQKNRDR